MPYTLQTSLGWSHELASSTVVTMDFVRADGRDLNVRPRINTGIVGGGATYPRRLSFLNLNAERHRHPAGDQRRREQVHRAHHRASSAGC